MKYYIETTNIYIKIFILYTWKNRKVNCVDTFQQKNRSGFLDLFLFSPSNRVPRKLPRFGRERERETNSKPLRERNVVRKRLSTHAETTDPF